MRIRTYMLMFHAFSHASVLQIQVYMRTCADASAYVMCERMCRLQSHAPIPEPTTGNECDLLPDPHFRVLRFVVKLCLVSQSALGTTRVATVATFES